MNGKPVTPVSVVIPTYQRRDSLMRLLSALASQTLPPSLFEAVVVIDGSQDGTCEALQDSCYPFKLLWLRQPHRGRPAARNAGIRLSSGGLIVFLDDDMQPAAGFLAAHLEAHRSNSSAVVVGAVPVLLEGDSPQAAAYIAEKFAEHVRHLEQPGHPFTFRDFFGSNFSVHRQGLLDAGLFDETFSDYGNEDVELFYRLLQAGFTPLYAPDALAYQRYDKDFPHLAGDTFVKGRSAVYLVGVHPGAYPGIKLSTYSQCSCKWYWMREILLAAGRRAPVQVEAFVAGLGSFFEKSLARRSPRSLSLYYRLSLDYLYWLGAVTAGYQPGKDPPSLDWKTSKAAAGG